MANDNIVAVHPFHDAGREATGAELMHANPYRPWPARITSITELTPTEKLFEFRFVDERIREAFRQEPGQFVELSIFGVGEAPISISSSPTKSGFIELCVRRTGRFTERLHQMQCGEIVGIRGPFGRGFPIDKMRGHDVLLVAGGLGIAPLRSLINNIHDERSEFGKVTIIYGSKNPSEVMFRNQFEMWKHRRDFELHLTVDNADEGWDGEVGLVTKPFEHLEIDPSNTFGALLWAAGDVPVRRAGDAQEGYPLRSHLHELRAPHEVRRGQVRALPGGPSVLLYRRARIQLLGSQEHSGVDVNEREPVTDRRAPCSPRGRNRFGQLLRLPDQHHEHRAPPYGRARPDRFGILAADKLGADAR